MNRTLLVSVIAATLALVACKNENPSSTGAAASAAPATTGAAKTAGPTTTAAATTDSPVGIKAGEVFGGSCDTVANDSECGEILVASAAEKSKAGDALKQLCSKGTASTDKICPSDKMVGTCRVGKDMINHYYSSGPKAYTAETAKQKCEKSMGHWVQ